MYTQHKHNINTLDCTHPKYLSYPPYRFRHAPMQHFDRLLSFHVLHQPPKSVQVRIERAFQHHETAACVLSTENQANVERTLRKY